MAKKGFFSWFRKDKSNDEAEQAAKLAEQQAAEAAAEAERLAAEKAQAEQAEADRLATEKAQAEQAEAERIAAEKAQAEQAEAERIAAEKAQAERAEAERLAAEKAQAEQAEAERIAAEKAQAEQAEAERIAAEKAQAERAEAERLAAEKAQAEQAEVERIAAENAQAERAEAERLAAEKAQAEAERLAAEKAEAERIAAEKAQVEQAEAERLAVERAQAEQAEAERLAAEKAQAEQAEAERLAAEKNQAEQAADEEAQPEPQAKPVKEGFFARLKRGLMRTSENIGSGFIGLFRGKKIDDDLFEELEEQLLIADVGVETTSRLISSLTDHASRKQLKDAEALYELLQQEMLATLEPVSVPLVPDNAAGPFVILMVGVNGVGKTTTIGKLAKQYQREGKSVMLAAGDTFRAAAVEQLQVWGQRNDIPVIAQHTGADSASVLFDALQAAKARNVDVLIADTAGRLQNKSHLMEELKKVVRVMKKLDPDAPHEVMLTLDASTGQNAISQAQLFQEAVGVTGISISKLDGTAKGGVIFAIADKFGIPIRYIGVGEQIDDLRTFNAKDFIEALFSQEKADN
ncbi:signal recognition particle-docking protein FtsY [Shewanella algae]|uniref:signal recognition particle-docking protein FtsY n=3 Tax=Shewanella algae TaxID=38313 RepID=UPI000D136870|nr:signal recognition particle-docking protein FtsY [Shewanella algae]EKT4487802.1 signal recognition particle-docking protein FtsY [Shewanella algae]MBO2550106.1 signal recognition particle-docking protein FtsY [Shewanella algae]WKC41691.1 signal recognition particle-docking protein FtsY [Shewanella algae]